MSLAQKIKDGQKVIGRRKYEILKTYDFENMTPEEMVRFREERKMSVAEAENQINLYEEKFIPTPEQKLAQEEYLKRILKNEKPMLKKLNAEDFYKIFIKRYKELYHRDYNVKKGSYSLENLKTLIFYFTKDQRFFNQKNIIESVDFGSKIKISKPSFEKGFILIGGYGTGKTSTMKTIESILRDFKINGYNVDCFKGYTTKDIADLYESTNDPISKKEFWDMIKKGRLFFDDLKSEDKASNFGIKNTMQDVIEKREYMIDFISCNYSDSKPNDIPEALLEIARNYGSRVFDRIFSKWNIIEFKGSSYRG